MSYRHIQIEKRTDGYGYIIGDSSLNEVVKREDMILVPDNFSAENKRWNYDNSEWEEFIPSEPEPQPLSEQEQIDIDTALNVEYIACLMESSLA